MAYGASHEATISGSGDMLGGAVSIDFLSDDDLLARLSANPQRVVYLVGSAVSAPSRPCEPGVPGCERIIDLIRAELQDPGLVLKLDGELQDTPPQNRYQVAFRFLHRKRDQDFVNAVIRRAVLMARRPTCPPIEGSLDPARCRELEDDDDGWHLTPAVEALGQLLARTNERRVVLTPNFDPLVEISVRRAGGQAFTLALHGDGSLPGLRPRRQPRGRFRTRGCGP
jgi:hypothetical protein